MHSGYLFRGRVDKLRTLFHSFPSFYPFIPSWIGWKHCQYGTASHLDTGTRDIFCHFLLLATRALMRARVVGQHESCYV